MNIITELTIFLRKTRWHYRKTHNFNPNYKQPEKQVFVVNPVSLNYYQCLGFSKNFLIGLRLLLRLTIEVVKRNNNLGSAIGRCGAHRRKLRTTFWHVYYFFIGITSMVAPIVLHGVKYSNVKSSYCTSRSVAKLYKFLKKNFSSALWLDMYQAWFILILKTT